MTSVQNKPFEIKAWRDKKVAVVGMGLEGKSSARYLKKYGAKVTILDQKQGGDYLKNLDKYDFIIRSPGVKLVAIQNAINPTDSLGKGGKQNPVITSQTKLFFELCPCPIIGVTGTKGKGTTSTLIYEMLKKQGFDAYLGGNIGMPPFDFLEKLTSDSRVVLELSSFQLQDLTKSSTDARAMAGKPHIAVMLMVTSEHLDYHADVYEYIDAKRNLLRFQTLHDFAIINRDYPASNESDIHTEGKVYFVSREREVAEGCFVKKGKVVVRIGSPQVARPVPTFPMSGYSSLASSNELRAHGSPSRATSQEIEIISTKDILLPGKHNLENVCAAIMAALLAGVAKENIVSVLKTFKGLEHRLELIAEIKGVKYYNDSFSTTPETAIAAIEAFEEPKILILGGSSKDSDFEKLGEVICNSKSIRAIIGIGKEWPRIKSAISNPQSPINFVEGARSMHQIVLAASKLATSGDVVLLSPACASFDMFKNYKDRGEQFKKEVYQLMAS